ncbi:MAG TPA: c-type cytochrome [Vicinamibacterales bacterium]|nr:c-type cytochrome [Vicinamibacterales bacterium]
MRRVLCGAVTMSWMLTAALGAQAPAAGQGRAGGPPPAPPANLQVLPKDIPRPQLLQTMQAFTQALGVQCSHCHQFVGPGDPMNDMASDVKPQKNAARAMMRLVAVINPQVATAVNKTPDTATRVGCIMCHRGEAIPTVPPPPAPAAPRGGGPPPAGGAAPPAVPGAAR